MLMMLEKFGLIEGGQRHCFNLACQAKAVVREAPPADEQRGQRTNNKPPRYNPKC